MTGPDDRPRHRQAHEKQPEADGPESERRAGYTIRSADKVKAWHLINDECMVAEQTLFALVDAVSCLLAHGGPDGGMETARLALETVVPPAVALAAVRTLLQDELAV